MPWATAFVEASLAVSRPLQLSMGHYESRQVSASGTALDSPRMVASTVLIDCVDQAGVTFDP
eukprot:3869231-Pyramimonas_sp.AAC.1